MSTPTIAGLTARQKTIADLIWSCNTEDIMVSLIRSLPTAQDRADATTLVKLMIHECWEQEHGLDQYEQPAAAVIDRARTQ